MKTKGYFIDSLINRDVVDNKTNETVTLKDCLSNSSTIQQQQQQQHNIQISVSTSAIQLSTNTPNSMSENLYREDARYKTFNNWPHTFIDAKKLSQTGFYYIGPGDNVKCYFCKVEIGRWEPEDNEVTEHNRWSPNCPLLKRRETNNVPINETELNALLPQQTYDVCGPYGSAIDIRHGSYAESSFTVQPTVNNSNNVQQQQQQQHQQQQSSINNSTMISMTSMRSPDHPEYAIESARLRSFDDWPKTMKQSAKDLSDAGFFYTQTGDRVKCFSCGGGLRDWDENDVPWEQHAIWFGRCEYLKLIKGQTYIDSIIASKNQQDTIGGSNNLNGENVPVSGNSSSSSSSSSNSNNSDDDSELNVNQDCLKTTATNSSSVLSPSSLSSPAVDDSSIEKKICESRLCKICYSCEYNTAFFPCGHVVACAKCASSVTKCPMCRKRFEHVIRVYFS